MNNHQTVVALGFFDGVHLGHQEILHATVKLAAELGATPAALTFDPHPQGQCGGRPPLLITPLEERVALLKLHGAEEVIVIPFDRAFALTSPERFIHDILIGRHRAAGVVCGDSFRFGAGAAGRAEDIGQIAPALRSLICPPVTWMGRVISSTLIRELVQEGRVEEAAQALGRPFALGGRVMHGEGRGRTLGFPTINLAFADGLVLPQNGVYATRVNFRGESRAGVTNVGVRPTFGQGSAVSVETHLPGWTDGLYGEAVSIAFLRRLREERPFATAQELKEQVARDVERALEEERV